MRSYAMRAREIGTLAAAVLAVGAAPAAAEQPACGEVLTADVQLQADLVDCPGHGLVIGADGVDIDLDGHTIDGAFAGNGIDNTAGYDGVGVAGGTVTGFRVGVALTGADDAVLRGLSVTRNGEGVVASESDRLLVEHSSVRHSGYSMRQGDGIVIRASDDVRILQVTTYDAEASGLMLFGSPRAQVDKLTATDNYGGGVGVYRSPETAVTASTLTEGLGVTDSAGSRILNNRVSSPFGGISITGSSPGTVVADNYARGNHSGSMFVSSDRVRVERNVIGSTIEDGIRVTGTRVRLLDNIVSGSFGDGILVTAAATGAYLEHNTVSGANADGIDIDTPDAVLRRNVATGNGELGIEGVRGIKARGWNFAWGNDDERQCTFVRCRAR